MTDKPQAEALKVNRRVRHIKRGTTYTVLGVGRAQGRLDDDDPIVLYEGEDKGLWARHQAEFCDGRFEEIEARATIEPSEAMVEKVSEAIHDFFDERFPGGAQPDGRQLFADDNLDAGFKHEAGCDEMARAIIKVLETKDAPRRTSGAETGADEQRES